MMRLGLWAVLYLMVAAQVDNVMAMECPPASGESEEQSSLKRKRVDNEADFSEQELSSGDDEEDEEFPPSQTRRLNVEEEGRGRTTKKRSRIQTRRYSRDAFIEDDESIQRQKLPFHLRVKACGAVHEYLNLKSAILIVIYDKYHQDYSMSYIPLALINKGFQSFFAHSTNRVFADERTSGSLECRKMVYDLSPALYKSLYGVIPHSLSSRKNGGPFLRSENGIKATENSEELDVIEEFVQGSRLLPNTSVHADVYQLSNAIDDQRDGSMDLGAHGRDLACEDPSFLGNWGTSGFLMIPYYFTQWFSSETPKK